MGCYYAWLPQQDLVKSRFWYLEAAKNGSPTAQYEIGFTLLLGEGGSAEPAAAVEWLENAALSDDEDVAAQTRRLLGDLFAGGLHGVQMDKKRAAYWRTLTNAY